MGTHLEFPEAAGPAWQPPGADSSLPTYKIPGEGLFLGPAPYPPNPPTSWTGRALGSQVVTAMSFPLPPCGGQPKPACLAPSLRA